MKRALSVILGGQVITILTVLLLGVGPAIAPQLATMAFILTQIMTKKTKLAPSLTEEDVETRVAARTADLQSKMIHYEQQAMTDALTGLLNRRGGEESIRHHISRSKRVGTAISFVLMDIDKFKDVNDRYGHATGDLVISGVTNRMKEVLRESDFGIRWGGEEFLIVLPDTDLEGAIVAAEKIRVAIEKLDFDITPVTVSMGVAELGADPFHLALARADMHLYFAKSKGRNQTFPNSLLK